MKIGLVGYQGSGKSTLFEWLTGVPADPSLAHAAQSAMAEIPEPRLAQLAEIYHAKKVTAASLELVDTPGLSRTHEGNAQRLALIHEAECLLLVVAAHDGSDPAADLRSFGEDLTLADMEVLGNRIARIDEALKKPLPRAEHDQLVHERQMLQIVLGAIESGEPLREAQMTEELLGATRAFRLLSEKPRMLVVNTSGDEEQPGRFQSLGSDELPVMAFPADLELELSKMEPDDRHEFEQEMGLEGTDRDHVIERILSASGQIRFFTCNEKEVRGWLLPQGGTAQEAAGSVHTDLARGFIRAEVVAADELIRLGQHEVKAQHLLRQESKHYVVQDGEVILVRFSV